MPVMRKMNLIFVFLEISPERLNISNTVSTQSEKQQINCNKHKY